jgi:hypothetical protein
VAGHDTGGRAGQSSSNDKLHHLEIWGGCFLV